MKKNRLESLMSIVAPLVRILPLGKVYSEPWEDYYGKNKTLAAISKEEDTKISTVNARIEKATNTVQQAVFDMVHFEPAFQEMGISLLKPFELLRYIQKIQHENRELRFLLENKAVQENETHNPHILNIPISETLLEQKTIDRLQEVKIFTLGDLADKKKTDLYKIRNFGFRRVSNLESLLKEHGLSFKK